MLDLLSHRELEIYRFVQAAAGTADTINHYLQQQGIFSQYRQIHQAYLDLANFKMERAVRNEALKRALFLGWYSDLEPAAFTGLADLQEDKVTEAFFTLNKIIERGWMNEELEWMLQHYARWSWVILQYTENKLRAVSNWVKAADLAKGVLPSADVLQNSMNRRGLMGLYFKEVGEAGA